MHGWLRCTWLALVLIASNTAGEETGNGSLRTVFTQIASESSGRVGICAEDARAQKQPALVCLNGDARFSLQSVVKIITAMAVMEAIDLRHWRWDDPVLVRKEDLSIGVQPIETFVTGQGYRTTLGDLVKRAVTDSDSAANDILMRKLGGPQEVQAFLDRHGIEDISVTRDERHLQTEIRGLLWNPAYTVKGMFQAALAAVPLEQRAKAWRNYKADLRDTATPRGMALLLHKLAAGKLLSAQSTERLLEIMHATKTFPNRLKAGLRQGWTLGHKTGSSGEWQGLHVATNDVGIFTAPDGRHIAIAIFIADTRDSEDRCSEVIARLSRAVVDHYH